MTQQHFSFTKQSVRAVLLATIMPLGFFVALMAIPLVIIWFRATSMLTMPVSYAYLAVFYIIFAVLHLFFILFLLNRIRQRFSLGVMLDDEGIWYEQTGKTEGLVSWSRISRIKNKIILRRCHLLDKDGNILLKVDYFLQNFSQLHDIIAEKIYANSQSPRQTFAKTAKHKKIYACSIAVFVGLSLLGSWVSTLIMLFFTGIIILEYATTVSKITLSDRHFILGFPWHEKIIPFTEITDIKTTTRRSQECSFFQIGIFVEGRRKPYCLTKLGIDDRELLMILRQAAGKTITFTNQ